MVHEQQVAALAAPTASMSAPTAPGHVRGMPWPRFVVTVGSVLVLVARQPACPVIGRISDNSDTSGRGSDVRSANLMRSRSGNLADFLIRRQECRCLGKCSPVNSTWSPVAAHNDSSY